MKRKFKKIERGIYFRITDLGAVEAIHMTKNALLHIVLTENMYKVKNIKRLKEKLKEELKKYIGWIEKRERDGTLVGRYTVRDLNQVIKSAKKIIAWKLSPPKKDLISIKKEKEDLLSFKEPFEKVIGKIKVVMDTNLLLSCVIKNDPNYVAAKILVGYLKPQQKYFELYIPNFVFLELISQLKKIYKFSKVKNIISNIFDEINPRNVYIGGIQLDMLDIYERYKLFSRKKISSILKGNDFLIATEGILNKAMILTSDKQFYKNCRKIYKETYLISFNGNNDFSKFVKEFEERRRKLRILRYG